MLVQCGIHSSPISCNQELEEACRVRGIPPTSSPVILQRKLDEWIKLSVRQRVPHSLLVLSRSFTVGEKLVEEEESDEEETERIDEDLSESVAQTFQHLSVDAIDEAKEKIADLGLGADVQQKINQINVTREQQLKIQEEAARVKVEAQVRLVEAGVENKAIDADKETKAEQLPAPEAPIVVAAPKLGDDDLHEEREDCRA